MAGRGERAGGQARLTACSAIPECPHHAQLNLQPVRHSLPEERAGGREQSTLHLLPIQQLREELELIGRPVVEGRDQQDAGNLCSPDHKGQQDVPQPSVEALAVQAEERGRKSAMRKRGGG